MSRANAWKKWKIDRCRFLGSRNQSIKAKWLIYTHTGDHSRSSEYHVVRERDGRGGDGGDMGEEEKEVVCKREARMTR